MRRQIKTMGLVALTLVLVALLSGCWLQKPGAEQAGDFYLRCWYDSSAELHCKLWPTPTPLRTPMPTNTLRPTATQFPSPKPTVTATPTRTPMPTSTVTQTGTPTATRAATPTATPTALSGSVYYVAPHGNDANPGTESQPWRTIQKAANALVAGDTVYIRGGAYNESVRFFKSGTQGNPITLTNYGNEIVTINGGGGSAIVDTTGTEYWVIEGIRLDSNAKHTILFDNWDCPDGTCGGTNHWVIRNNYIIGAVQIRGNYNLFEGNEVDGSQHKGAEDGVWELYAAHHNVYRDNHIHDFNSRGIWSMHRTHDSLFENNHIHHTGGQCLDTDGFGNVEWRHVIRGNHIHDCGTDGIEMENTFDSLVENNIIHDTGTVNPGWPGIVVINYGNYFFPGECICERGGENNQYGNECDCEGDITNNIIRQNIIYNAGEWGGIEGHNAGGVKVWGNTIYGGKGPGIALYFDCPGWEVRSNIIVENSGEAILGEPAVSDHNLFSDARFVNSSQNDFRLRADSPAIDAGVDIGLSMDIDGNPRPQGAGYDIGAYEYVLR